MPLFTWLNKAYFYTETNNSSGGVVIVSTNSFYPTLLGHALYWSERSHAWSDPSQAADRFCREMRTIDFLSFFFCLLPNIITHPPLIFRVGPT